MTFSIVYLWNTFDNNISGESFKNKSILLFKSFEFQWHAQIFNNIQVLLSKAIDNDSIKNSVASKYF